jgi:hypothetical protein
VIVVERTIERELTKQHRTSFTTIRKVRDKFHCNFKEGMTTHPHGYRGVNVGEITNA